MKEIGNEVIGVRADSSELADLDSCIRRRRTRRAKIDILFASAGDGSFASVEEVTEEQFNRTFNTNVRGTLFTVQKGAAAVQEQTAPSS